MATITHRGVRESDGQAVTLYETIEQISDGRGGTMPGLRSMRDGRGDPYNLMSSTERTFRHFATNEVVRLLN